MRAIIFHEHGGPEVLTHTEMPPPEPKAGEVLVGLEAAALNHMDLWVRKGWSGIDIEYPHIPGADGAGRITELGENVSGWKVGERVVINSNIADGTCEFCLAGYENQCRNWHLLGESLPGTYREFISVPATNLRRIPEGFDAHIAASAALVFMTAWHSLVTRANLQPGETVLVVGASGGVNTASIQIAKHLGATVYVVGSNSEKLSLAKKMGADHLINRSQEKDWSRSIHKLTNKRGVDIVVDSVGTTFPLSMRAVRKGGRILTVGNTGGAKFEIDNRYIFGKHLSILGSTMGTPNDFATVMDLVFAGKLSPVLDKTFPLKDAQAAHQRLEAGEQMGKITLEI